jgi:ATP-dependent Clp protease protease subunit
MSDVVDLILPEEGVTESYNMQLADPTAIVQHCELKERTIWIYDVDADLFDTAVRWIMEWNREDAKIKPENRKPIKLMIFSYGGSLDVANSLISVIEASKTPIIGVATGTCCSAGFYILLACHKRYCTRFTNFLLHQGSTSGVGGEFKSVVQQSENYKKQVKELTDWAFEKMTISKAKYNREIKGEWFMSTDEAENYGVVDKTIKSLDEVYE